MRGMLQLAAILMISVAGSAACVEAPDGDEPIAESEAALITANGVSLNGVEMNGVEMNGVEMNGVEMNGVEMNGVEMNGVEMNGTELTGVLPGGEVVSGTDFIGAVMTAVLSSGAEIPLYIADIDPSSDPDILLYTVLYWNGLHWTSLCGFDGWSPVPAIPLSGRWDYSAGTATGGDHIEDPGSLTFACMGAALAKCTALGYKPWESAEECVGGECVDVPVRPLHQACTRMIRGDYCGDGTAHTLNGTPVNLWDSFGIQSAAQTDWSWRKEAEWSPEGAVCVSRVRRDNALSWAYINAHCPERRHADFACFGGGSTFDPANGQGTPLGERSLLRNEYRIY
jgi:hypothetical protein